MKLEQNLKGGDHETESPQGAERGRRDADRAGDDRRTGGGGPHVRVLQVEELARYLWDAGAGVVPRVWERKLCDSLVRQMRAGESRPTEPLNALSMKREPSEGARQKMHTVGSHSWFAVRHLLRTNEQLAEFLGPPFTVDNRVLFLSYEPGSFIAPHRDDPEGTEEIATAALILNDEFEGGEFVIHVEDRELVLDVPPGSLIVFRAGVLHSVREVTRGVRFSAVGSLNRPVAS